MRLPIHLKLFFACVLSAFALLLGIFSSTGTASAYSTVSQASPHISVSFVSERTNCVVVGIHGNGFHRNTHADLFTRRGGVNSFLKRVKVDRDGDFSTSVTVCGLAHREDIFFRDRQCFLPGVATTNINCLRRDSLLQNHPCFQFGNSSIASTCFRQHRFFTFFHGQIFIVAKDEATGRFSNTVSVRVDSNHF